LYYSIKFSCLVSLRADLQATRRIRLGRGTDIRPYVRLITTTGRISLGKKCGINSFTVIASGTSPITIGDYVNIGPSVTIIASNYGFDDPDTPMMYQKRVEKGIVIEDDVWIGASAVILDGVRIGRGSIIGAGAIVTKDVPTMSVAVGNPAHVIKKRNNTSSEPAPPALSVLPSILS
jgi:acetyltransferase-like isoleucine patch superfamily enzyme